MRVMDEVRVDAVGLQGFLSFTLLPVVVEGLSGQMERRSMALVAAEEQGDDEEELFPGSHALPLGLMGWEYARESAAHRPRRHRGRREASLTLPKKSLTQRIGWSYWFLDSPTAILTLLIDGSMKQHTTTFT